MGHKTNPISQRLGYTKGWESSWFTRKKDIGANLLEDYAIRRTICQHIQPDILSKIFIERHAKYVTITLYTSRSGQVIGPGGARAADLTQLLKKQCKKEIQLNVYEVKRPNLDAALVAKSITSQIAKRGSHKRTVKHALANVMRAGAKGVKIRIKGRPGGSEMARDEVYKDRKVPLHTFRADIDYHQAEAQTIYGKIGVKVWIFTKEVYGKCDLSLAPVAPYNRAGSRPTGKSRPPRR